MLSFSQIEILKLLLTHILQEKIEFATISEIKGGIERSSKENNSSSTQKTAEIKRNPENREALELTVGELEKSIEELVLEVVEVKLALEREVSKRNQNY